MRPLSAAQLAMLHRLVDSGPFRPVRGDHNTFYALERARLAFKREMLVYISDAGRLKVAEVDRAHQA